MKKQKKRNQGITLIALVVSIVVLLILAAVSISMLTGENGIITQAQDAKENTDIGNEKEIVNLAATGAKTKDALGKIKEENLRDELDELIGIGKYNLTGTGPYTVTYKESGRSYIVETNGSIIDSEEYEKKALKFLVNSGEDGTVVLPICNYNDGSKTINWGDGTVVEIKETASEERKLASKEIYMASTMGNGISHTYSEKNKEFIITVIGKCQIISVGYENVTKDKIIEIVQWGETGLEGIKLSECENLRKIASPNENSFDNVRETGFCYAFSECTSLKEIPEDLFSNCPQIISFEGTFANCTALTGTAPKLWERVSDGVENGYIGNPDGNSCFFNATGLSNYNDIPEYWK